MGEIVVNVKKSLATIGRATDLARMAAAARKVAKAQTEPDRETARRALAALMADARGIPMKIGQFLAAQSGSEAFDLLVRGSEVRSLKEMLSVLEAGLQRNVEEVFATVDESTAAGSLGQVHHARLADNREVAVKIRYPEIAEAVGAELRLLGLVPGLGPAKQWGFEIDSYKRELNENMSRELDYVTEAQQQLQFRKSVTVEGLVVPGIHEELCGEGVLVQSWESGLPLETARGWSVEDRRKVMTILMATFFKSLFCAGLVHCDPNLGNVSVRRDELGNPEVVLFDYGCVVEVPRSRRLALLKLILATIENDETDPLACFVEMGFDLKKLSAISEPLPALCRILFEPFLQSEPYSTKYWAMNSRVNKLLGDLRWWFRSAGPADQFLLMRAFSGLVAHLETVQIIVPWRKVLFEAVDAQTLEEARNFTPSPVPDAIRREATRVNAVADYLKVKVTQGGKDVVSVAMPAGQVIELETIVPEDVLEKITQSGIDLEAIRKEACARGIVPMELFEFASDTREYRVWLE